jgi:hypothetical protein
MLLLLPASADNRAVTYFTFLLRVKERVFVMLVYLS